MIQEYRKASAEKLKIKITGNFVIWGYPTGLKLSHYTYWKPDLKENAYQREMIEDWLIEQGFSLLLDYSAAKKDWKITLIDSDYNTYYIEDKSKPIAFMKAFMEWQRKEEG